FYNKQKKENKIKTRLEFRRVLYKTKTKMQKPIENIFKKKKKNSAIIKQAKKIKYPVVIKPYNGTGGKGVIANIKNKNELIDALKYVREDLKDRKSTRLNSSHVSISYAVFCLTKKMNHIPRQ